MRSGDPAFSSTGRRLGEAHLRLMAAKRRGPTASGLAVLVLVMAVLVACAPVQQGAFRPTQLVTAGFSEGWFETFDGARLGLNVWRPDTAQGGAADGAETVIVAVHGMNDYAGAFNGAGGWWAKRGATVYAYDQRGFGRSPNSGIWPEHELMRQDLRTAVEVARRLHPDARIAVVGESMGASVAVTAFASEKPPRADALVLSGPGLRGWGVLPVLYRVSLWASAHVRPDWVVVPPKGVRITPTDNRAKLIEMWNDPYVVVSIMEEADQTIGRLPQDTPTLLLYGARDEVIPEDGLRRAAARLPMHVQTAYYANGYHMLMNDLQAETVWADVLAFARSPGSPLPSTAPPLPWSPKRLEAAR